VVGEILLAHLVGDYVIQSDWMASEKTRRWWPAVAHAITYGLPFLVITRSVAALAVIVGTHAVIDRYRMARHVIWVKNHLAPAGSARSWRECSATGYPPEKPAWMAVWLMIACDNTLHLVLDVAAVAWL
jgi:hypothetical protein